MKTKTSSRKLPNADPTTGSTRPWPTLLSVFVLSCVTLMSLGALRTAIAAPPHGGGKQKLSLSVDVSPSNIAEGEVASGTVTHNNSDTGSPVTVSLTSSDTTEATVLAEVVIPAGASSADFTVASVSDGVADGEQLVTVSAAADGYRSANATLTVTDPAALPNVRYSIEAIPTPADGSVWINGLNNSGLAYGWSTVSGERSAWVYDQVTGLLYDLNQEATLMTQIDNLVGPGWIFGSIVGMNDRGDMVGYLLHADWPRRGFVIDTSSVTGQFSIDPADWIVGVLPEFGIDSYARRINDNGDILGVYQRADETSDAFVYNPWLDTPQTPTPAVPLGANLLNSFCELNHHGQIAGIDENGVAFIYDTFLGQWSWFEDAFYRQIHGLNDDGVFAGIAYTIETYAGGKKQRRGERVAFRHDTQFQPLGNFSMTYDALNASGDVGFTAYDGLGPIIDHTGFAPEYSGQTLFLADLIADDDPLKATFLQSSPDIFAINNRDETGYGQVVCRLYFPQPDGSNRTQAVILTPFIPAH